MQNKGKILASFADVEKLFCEKSIKKPFLCCGKSFMKTELFKKIDDEFSPVIWSDIRPNPRFEDMQSAARLFCSEKCDFIIGAGGGSPLDSAKMIKLMATNPPEAHLSGDMQANSIEFLAIPTTSGTGSEATQYSIFYVNENEKHSIAHPDFLPDYVILDASLLKTVPPYQRRCTCIDALCHAIESYWSVKSTNESKEFAKKAISLFFQNKGSYIANEDSGNLAMLKASYYAGKAISITSTTSAHAMCYSITINCSTAHGHSVGVNLAQIWEYMNKHNECVNDPRGRDYVLATLNELGIMLGGKDLNDGAEIFKNLLNEFNLGAPQAPLDTVLSFAKKVDPSRLSNNPTVLTSNDVTEIYKRVFDYA